MDKQHLLTISEDEYYPESKCCGLFRIRQGTTIVAILQLIVALLYTFHVIFFNMHTTTEFLNNCAPVGKVVVIVILLFGLHKEDHLLLIPYLVFKVCFLFSYFSNLQF